jgi:N-acetylmuramoyl-L-alanine amidase
MLPFAYYLLKITICAAVLFGYYWFALRNKVFHGYNRFYLLAIVGLSLVLPLCRIHIFQEKQVAQTSVIKMLQVVTASDEYMDEVVIGTRQKSNFSFIEILPLLYVLVSIVLSVKLVQMLLTIFVLRKKHKSVKIEQIHFINTDAAKGTPFSFFKYIFWNVQIDLHGPAGTRIFKHELAHIQEHHSWDKMFINLVLITFWINPIFWLIRRELSMIHEFIADKRAVEDGDTTAFAAMILATTYPQHNITIANNFFYSPIKRRLMMLTKNKHPKVNYISRLLVLPLLVIVFAAFTIKAKEYTAKQVIANNIAKTSGTNNVSQAGVQSPELKNVIKDGEGNMVQNIVTDKQITVLIDAGHGGTDNGAINKDGLTEKDVALQLVKKIKAANKNENIKIILTRETDVFQNVKEKAAFANGYNADLFISIHLDNTPKEKWNTVSGLNVFVSKEGSNNTEKSKLLASAIIGSFKNNYGLNVSENPQQRQHGVWILQANNFPSVLIEAGYLTNDLDVSYLLSNKGQERFAKNVLDGINNFAASSDFSSSNTNNNISSSGYNDKIKPNLKETNNKAEVDDVTVSIGDSIILSNVIKDSTEMVFLDNGRLINKILAMQLITDAKSLKIYSSKSAFETFGIRTKNGLIDIITKANQDTTKRIVFNQVEHDPEFPGGTEAWKKFLQKYLDSSIPVKEKWKPGMYRLVIKFIVEKDGSLSDISTENYVGSKTALSCINLMKNGPKWKPALQNGHIVAAYRKQPITFLVSE